MPVALKSTTYAPIPSVDISTVPKTAYTRHSVGCLVLTHDHKILLQQRDNDCARYPGCLGTFGGGIENDESPMQALVRELQEELGAMVNPDDVVTLGAISEHESENSSASELVYMYFWQDKQATISGCYEGRATTYNDPGKALQHPKIMNDVCWLLIECQQCGLI